MSRVAFAVAAIVSATGCARDAARQPAQDSVRLARLGACLDSAGRRAGDSAQVAAAVARCDSLAPAATGGVRVTGVITDRPRPDTGRH